MSFFDRKKNCLIPLIVLFLVFVFTNAEAFVAKVSYDCNAEKSREIRTTLKLKLAREWKKKKKAIKKDFKAANKALKFRLEFFAPRMTPPQNLGIGKCLSAKEGRLAIQKALEFNRGVEFVIMQEFMPHHWAMVGTTDLAELTFIKITPDELKQLSDPSLSTEQFQNRYRKLATLRERKLPFGMGTRKIEVEEP